jgi:hypothetical protein
LYFGILFVKRFGSTAEVRFVLEEWKEAKLHVTNNGPKGEFFASVWFQGAGTAGQPTPLFAHWGDDATKHRMPLARGQTGTITLGKVAEEPGGVRRWNLFATTHYDTLQYVKPLSFARIWRSCWW